MVMPPMRTTEDYLDLIGAVEETAATLKLPVILEGSPPPHDHRLSHIKVTPDPGVIEVNLNPADNWDELVKNTTAPCRPTLPSIDPIVLENAFTAYPAPCSDNSLPASLKPLRRLDGHGSSTPSISLNFAGSSS